MYILVHFNVRVGIIGLKGFIYMYALMPLSTIYHNGVRVMVFNATFNNISQ
jgi:hypothetical protein